MNDNEYQCSICKNIYERITPEKKALDEFEKNFPEVKNYPKNLVCDDCYNNFMDWFKTKTPAEKEEMRKKFIGGLQS